MKYYVKSWVGAADNTQLLDICLAKTVQFVRMVERLPETFGVRTGGGAGPRDPQAPSTAPDAGTQRPAPQKPQLPNQSHTVPSGHKDAKCKYSATNCTKTQLHSVVRPKRTNMVLGGLHVWRGIGYNGKMR